MKKKEGFTLIELLAVIVILAIIALIATPIILNIVRKARKSAFLDSSYGIIESIKLYYTESMLNGGMIEDKIFSFKGEVPEGLHYSGTSPLGGTAILKQDGKISMAIHNGEWCAVKGISVSNVTITNYEEGKCIIKENAKDPIITLNGEKEIRLKQGETYKEEGANAKTIDGEELPYNIEIKIGEEIVSSVETTSIGNIYIVTYSATSNNKTATVTRTVTIIDGIAPEITFDETYVTSVTADNVSKVNLLTGVIVTDNSGETIVPEVTGNLSAITGNYEITYKATDSAGNSTSVTKTITVTEASAPILNFSVRSTTGYVKNQTVTISASVSSNNNDAITAFYYSLDGGSDVAVSVTGSKTSESTNIILNTTGSHTIKIKATGKYSNNNEDISGTYYVDATAPTVGNPSVLNSSTYGTTKTINVTVTDSHSGVYQYLATTNSSSTAPTSGWSTLGSNITTSNYTLSLSVNSNGNYYIWVKDKAGNTKRTSSYASVTTIDKTAPTITTNYSSTAYVTREKSSVSTFSNISNNAQTVTTLYTVQFGSAGGNVTCKNGSTTITNLSNLAVGSYTLACTATSNSSGQTSKPSVNVKVTIKVAGKSPSEIMTNENAGANGTIRTDYYGNKRYSGTNPNNYVCFGTDAKTCSGKQLWRIIGVIDGNLKLINTQYYSKEVQLARYPFNYTWSNSDLTTEFHNNVYNSTEWILSNIQKLWMTNNYWRVGGPAESNTLLDKYEDAEFTGGYTTSNYIGLMTATDFGYASSNADCKRNYWVVNPLSHCFSNNWLKGDYEEWVMTNGPAGDAWLIDVDDEYLTPASAGSGPESSTSNSKAVRPVVILNSDVKIATGTGTSSNPYILTD